MIRLMLEYCKAVLKNYEKSINFLIFSIFFNLFLYLKDIFIIFDLSNIDFSFKNLLSFLTFVFSFLSISFIFFIVLLILIDSIRKLLRVKIKFGVSFFILFLNAIFIYYIVLNLKVFKLLGVHLHDKIALKAFNLGGIKNDMNLSFDIVLSELIKPSFIFISAILSYFAISFIIRKIKRLSTISNFSYFIVYPVLFSIFLSFYLWSKMNSLASLVPVCSFLKSVSMVSQIESIYKNDINSTKLTNKKNIIIVVSESLRGDVFNKSNMPNMFNFIDKNRDSSIIPEHNFSASHFTLYSIFSIWYSVWSYHYRVFTSFGPYKDSAAMKLFTRFGYESLFLSASHILEYDESFKKLTKQFNKYQEFSSDRKMLDWFKNHYDTNLSKSEKPFIVFLFIYASHFNYRYPEKFKKYLPVIEDTNKKLVDNTFNMDRKYKTEIFNRYKNSVLYVDSLFNEVLLSLNKKDRDDTIIVFTGDHGEAFWEHETFGHAQRSYKKEIVEVPLLLYLPSLKEKVNVKLSSHVDILPTILDYISDISLEDINSYFNGVSLLRKNEARYTIVSSLEPIGASDGKFCLVNEKGKLVFKTTKFTNNGKFIPLEFTNYKDFPLNKQDSSYMLNSLENFEKDYFKFFYFEKK